MASTAVREKPIIFSGDMVKAILAGRKSQTRRIVKGPQLGPEAHWQRWEGDGVYRAAGLTGDIPAEWRGKLLYSPYEIGMRLWVREAWLAHWGDDSRAERRITEGELKYGVPTEESPLCLYYRATFGDKAPWPHLKWTPAIHMYRWASRITLEITGVRVERLNSISHKDALAEGVEYDVSKPDGSPLARFQKLWESIHGDGSWEASPFVWCISFRRLEDLSA